jgi:putative ABC transport system permease protein
MGVPWLFDAGINLLSFLFSAAIGVIFGQGPVMNNSEHRGR